MKKALLAAVVMGLVLVASGNATHTQTTDEWRIQYLNITDDQFLNISRDYFVFLNRIYQQDNPDVDVRMLTVDLANKTVSVTVEITPPPVQ